ncbi:11075_t:CDS:2 [Acaulospora morrowiae]|uniref:11075_t:CDS:1 n=1 Tax=Acaulospora morrowiae TaxID=94023 RepID=A0A9N9HX68_9GLOM|nr:11075_t:CDS:2 [Acaulospora morrowiae]
MDIPRLSERLGCMIYRRRFEMEVEELKPEIEVLHEVYIELKESVKFKRLLKASIYVIIIDTILVIGNHLNRSTFRGNAVGFQIDCLLKIQETKALDNNPKGAATLLHYLVLTLEDTQKDLLTFMDELKHLEAAARISVVTVVGSVASLVSGIESIKEEISILKKSKLSPKGDIFCETMEDFVKKFEPTIESINEFTEKLEEELKQLLIYYGEDPATTKPEEFFGMILSFSKAFTAAKHENEKARKRAEKERQRENNIQARLASRRPSDTSSIASSMSGKGDFDDAIRDLRSGLKKSRTRPVSKVFTDLQVEVVVQTSGHIRGTSSSSHHRGASSIQHVRVSSTFLHPSSVVEKDE